MKLEPVFFVKENKLYKIEGSSPVDTQQLEKIEILWSKIELEDGIYNEEFLASLREQLKSFEVQKKFAILIPVIDKPLENSEQIESFTNACNHTARRVKDCISVAGFEIPAQITDFQDFIEVLSKKHAQYVYFSHNKEISDSSIVVY